jgi:hypothetical protein
MDDFIGGLLIVIMLACAISGFAIGHKIGKESVIYDLTNYGSYVVNDERRFKVVKE